MREGQILLDRKEKKKRKEIHLLAFARWMLTTHKWNAWIYSFFFLWFFLFLLFNFWFCFVKTSACTSATALLNISGSLIISYNERKTKKKATAAAATAAAEQNSFFFCCLYLPFATCYKLYEQWTQLFSARNNKIDRLARNPFSKYTFLRFAVGTWHRFAF